MLIVVYKTCFQIQFIWKCSQSFKSFDYLFYIMLLPSVYICFHVTCLRLSEIYQLNEFQTVAVVKCYPILSTVLKIILNEIQLLV